MRQEREKAQNTRERLRQIRGRLESRSVVESDTPKRPEGEIQSSYKSQESLTAQVTEWKTKAESAMVEIERKNIEVEALREALQRAELTSAELTEQLELAQKREEILMKKKTMTMAQEKQETKEEVRPNIFAEMKQAFVAGAEFKAGPAEVALWEAYQEDMADCA